MHLLLNPVVLFGHSPESEVGEGEREGGGEGPQAMIYTP